MPEMQTFAEANQQAVVHAAFDWQQTLLLFVL
jgi:hypothetical protein